METLYKILTRAHSGWRWVVLLLLLVAIIKMVQGWKKGAHYTEGDRKLGLFTMIAFHLQFVIGLVLYFISPKVQFIEGVMANKMLRFYTLEHIAMMTVAMILITMGYSKAKKTSVEKQKFRIQAIFYTMTLLIVLLSIPWPFRDLLGGKWF
ncbi:MAG: hypothetical protein WDZ35_11610 [Crocinitomicaceae bacterium]